MRTTAASADKVCVNMFFFFRHTIFFFAESDALHEKRHISGENPHGLQSLDILRCLTLRASVHAVPVLAGCHWHTGDGEILVQLIVSGGAAASSCHGNAGAELHALVKAGAVKEPVKTGDESGVGGSVVDRAGNDETVCFLELWCQFIDNIVKNAAAFSAQVPQAMQPLTSLLPIWTVSTSMPSSKKVFSISFKAMDVLPSFLGLPLIIKTFMFIPPGFWRQHVRLTASYSSCDTGQI